MKHLLAPTLLATILSLWLTAAAWAGFDEGVAAYNRGDYKTAIEEWLPVAEQGNARAQYNLGVMFYFGEGVQQDYVAAGEWYEKAAEQGNAAALRSIINMYENGIGVTQNNETAAEWQSRLSDLVDKQAEEPEDSVSSRLYMVGIEDPEAVRSFLKRLKQAALNDDREALTTAIRCPFSLYDSGKIIKTYKDAQGVLEDFNNIFTHDIKAAIVNAKYENLFVNSQGVMINNGEVWFDGWGAEIVSGSAIMIKAINP
jgi:hypothetical protein